MFLTDKHYTSVEIGLQIVPKLLLMYNSDCIYKHAQTVDCLKKS